MFQGRPWPGACVHSGGHRVPGTLRHPRGAGEPRSLGRHGPVKMAPTPQGAREIVLGGGGGEGRTREMSKRHLLCFWRWQRSTPPGLLQKCLRGKGAAGVSQSTTWRRGGSHGASPVPNMSRTPWQQGQPGPLPPTHTLPGVCPPSLSFLSPTTVMDSSPFQKMWRPCHLRSRSRARVPPAHSGPLCEAQDGDRGLWREPQRLASGWEEAQVSNRWGVEIPLP